MSCKLWDKITSVSVNINFGAKMSMLCKKCEILGEMLTFSLSVHYYWKWLSFCKMCLFLEKKSDFLCEGLYMLTKCQILIKNFNFFGYVNLYVLFFIKVFHFSDNCYFDSKYHFVQWYFGQVSFS